MKAIMFAAAAIGILMLYQYMQQQQAQAAAAAAPNSWAQWQGTSVDTTQSYKPLTGGEGARWVKQRGQGVVLKQ
jgi:hypothetical protein